MFKKYLFLTSIPLVAVPTTSIAHELVMNFDPLEGQTEEQMLADLDKCKEQVIEDGTEEPHPLREKDPLERRAESSGAGAGVSVGGVGVGVGVGGASSSEGRRESALKDAKHLQRHRAYEIAVTACMEEKGYDK